MLACVESEPTSLPGPGCAEAEAAKEAQRREAEERKLAQRQEAEAAASQEAWSVTSAGRGIAVPPSARIASALSLARPFLRLRPPRCPPRSPYQRNITKHTTQAVAASLPACKEVQQRCSQPGWLPRSRHHSTRSQQMGHSRSHLRHTQIRQ